MNRIHKIIGNDQREISGLGSGRWFMLCGKGWISYLNITATM